MNINGTLFVQAFNFFLAYLLLRKLLLKPAVTIIHEDAAYHHGLRSAIETRKAALASKEDETLKHWQAFQNLYRDKVPVGGPVRSPSLAAQIIPEYQTITSQEARDLASQVTQSMLERVDYVRR